MKTVIGFVLIVGLGAYLFHYIQNILPPDQTASMQDTWYFILIYVIGFCLLIDGQHQRPSWLLFKFAVSLFTVGEVIGIYLSPNIRQGELTSMLVFSMLFLLASAYRFAVEQEKTP